MAADSHFTFFVGLVLIIRRHRASSRRTCRPLWASSTATTTPAATPGSRSTTSASIPGPSSGRSSAAGSPRIRGSAGPTDSVRPASAWSIGVACFLLLRKKYLGDIGMTPMGQTRMPDGGPGIGRAAHEGREGPGRRDHHRGVLRGVLLAGVRAGGVVAQRVRTAEDATRRRGLAGKHRAQRRDPGGMVPVGRSLLHPHARSGLRHAVEPARHPPAQHAREDDLGPLLPGAGLRGHRGGRLAGGGERTREPVLPHRAVLPAHLRRVAGLARRTRRSSPRWRPTRSRP